MGELANLPNLGKVLEQQLCDVGISTADELRQVGGRDAWLRILARDPSACMNRLLALEGAVRGLKKAQLDEGVREELREFYHRHKGK